MLTFYLVRHGMTEGNYAHIIMGGRIDTPLTAAGLVNAETTAKGLSGVAFDAIYASDLGRAFITAHILAERLGLEKRLFPAKELREIDYGDLTFQHKEDITREYPGYKTDPDHVFPNGESFRQLQRRAVAFLDRLEEKHGDGTLLLVSHAGVIRAILCRLKGYALKEHLTMRVTHEYIGKFVVDGGRLVAYERLHE